MKRFLNKEIIYYIFFGGITTAVHYIFYYLFRTFFFKPDLSNIIAILIAVIFAFFVNKIFVFESKNFSAEILKEEAILFFSGRLLTTCLDVIMFKILRDTFNIDEYFARFTTTLLVLVLNYVLSKKSVFKK